MIKKSLVLIATSWLVLLTGPSVAVAPLSPAQTLIAPLFGPNTSETRAVLLIKDGHVVAKRYGAGYSDANRFISWSMAKSVTAVLIGELVADGKLTLDAPVPFAEWQGKDDARGTITLRHMLNMSSGLNHTEGLDPKEGAAGVLKSDTASTIFVNRTQDMAARALTNGMEAKAGTHFEYSSLTSLLLSELITRQLTDSKDAKVRAAAYRSFAEARVFKPAGITSAVMEFDGAGTQIGGSIIYMSLDDWGRFGALLLGGRGQDGARVINLDWLNFLKTPSKTDGGYGGHFWLNKPRPAGADPALFPGTGPDTLFSAIGHLGQWVIVSPDQGLVLVRLGKTNDGDLQPIRDVLGTLVASIK